MEIKLGEGIDNISFGMSRKGIESILGQPDEIESYPDMIDSEYKTEAWHYDESEISASFDEIEEFRLSMLSTSDPEAKLMGKKVIGLNEDAFLKEIESLDLGEAEIEDWSTEKMPGNKVISYSDASLNFWFDNSILREITWSPYLDEDDNPIWPE